MTRIDSDKGDFLYGLFDEKIRSFLFYLDKAKKTYQIEDIHQLRVNTKRINAVYQLLESATALRFKAQSHLKPIKDIFKSAGKLREGQVNLELLKLYKLHPDPFMFYNINLEKSQVRTIRELKKAIRGFDKIAFDHTIKIVEDYCSQIDKTTLIDKMDEYIQHKAKLIKELLGEKQNPKNVHKIRKHLKSIDPVLSLLCLNQPERFNSISIESLKESAIYIGDFHDRVILLKSIERLVKDHKDTRLPPASRTGRAGQERKKVEQAFDELVKLIQEDINNLVEKINTTLNVTLKHIIH